MNTMDLISGLSKFRWRLGAMKDSNQPDEMTANSHRTYEENKPSAMKIISHSRCSGHPLYIGLSEELPLQLRRDPFPGSWWASRNSMS